MTDIATQAGVVRATIYVHFPTREALIEAITHRGISEVAQVIASAEPNVGEPMEALERVVAAAWRTLGRYHALVAINSRVPHEELHQRHGSALGALEPLIERGQRAGAFRADVPAAWHLATTMALIHGASGELSAGRIDENRSNRRSSPPSSGPSPTRTEAGDDRRGLEMAAPRSLGASLSAPDPSALMRSSSAARSCRPVA
jgi:AcrR family transcriptional regulator